MLPNHLWHLTHRCHEREFLLEFAHDRQWLALDEALESAKRGILPYVLLHAARGARFGAARRLRHAGGVSRQSTLMFPLLTTFDHTAMSRAIARANSSGVEWAGSRA